MPDDNSVPPPQKPLLVRLTANGRGPTNKEIEDAKERLKKKAARKDKTTVTPTRPKKG
jgi:hypothetical protein